MIARGVGCVTRTAGETVFAALPGARVGDGVAIGSVRGAHLTGEVAAVARARVAIVAYGSLAGIGIGDRVALVPNGRSAPAGYAFLGRAIDASGRALDGKGDPRRGRWLPCVASAPKPGARRAASAPFWTGIRVLDTLLVTGRGARVGIFGAPGCGKTSVLETVVASADADAVVIALVGERGREAHAWFERVDRRTTIVCATSDRAPSERARAAEVAMLQAQTLCARGLHVLLVVDSLARYAAALRERRVALGEAVGRGGYPPAVWAELARFLERAGAAANGSITLIATVLSDGADEREPLADAARSLLDGHIVLATALARAGHFPAIDVLASASRTMASVVTSDHARDARTVRAALALLAESKDARAVGLHAVSDAALASAVEAEPELVAFLRQSGATPASESIARLRTIAARLASR